MRKLFLTLGMVVLIGFGFSSCDNSEENVMEWDATPVQFYIQIKNADGIDMLDSTKHETFLKDITVKYEEKQYSIGSQESHAGTRYYLPEFRGLELLEYWSYKTFSLTGDWCLLFGQFDGAKNQTYTITLQLGDNSIKLSGSNSVSRTSNGSPNIIRKYYVNDEVLTDEAGELGRYHFIYTESGHLEYVPSKYE